MDSGILLAWEGSALLVYRVEGEAREYLCTFPGTIEAGDAVKIKTEGHILRGYVNGEKRFQMKLSRPAKAGTLFLPA